jgi:hypothetical protein
VTFSLDGSQKSTSVTVREPTTFEKNDLGDASTWEPMGDYFHCSNANDEATCDITEVENGVKFEVYKNDAQLQSWRDNYGDDDISLRGKFRADITTPGELSYEWTYTESVGSEVTYGGTNLYFRANPGSDEFESVYHYLHGGMSLPVTGTEITGSTFQPLSVEEGDAVEFEFGNLNSVDQNNKFTLTITESRDPSLSMTSVSPSSETLDSGDTKTITVSVQNESGQTPDQAAWIVADVDGSGTLDSYQKSVEGKDEVSFTYTAPDNEKDNTVDFTLDGSTKSVDIAIRRPSDITIRNREDHYDSGWEVLKGNNYYFEVYVTDQFGDPMSTDVYVESEGDTFDGPGYASLSFGGDSTLSHGEKNAYYSASSFISGEVQTDTITAGISDTDITDTQTITVEESFWD